MYRGLVQHIQLPENITNGRFSWVPDRPPVSLTFRSVNPLSLLFRRISIGQNSSKTLNRLEAFRELKERATDKNSQSMSNTYRNFYHGSLNHGKYTPVTRNSQAFITCLNHCSQILGISSSLKPRRVGAELLTSKCAALFSPYASGTLRHRTEHDRSRITSRLKGNIFEETTFSECARPDVPRSVLSSREAFCGCESFVRRFRKAVPGHKRGLYLAMMNYCLLRARPFEYLRVQSTAPETYQTVAILSSTHPFQPRTEKGACGRIISPFASTIRYLYYQQFRKGYSIVHLRKQNILYKNEVLYTVDEKAHFIVKSSQSARRSSVKCAQRGRHTHTHTQRTYKLYSTHDLRTNHSTNDIFLPASGMPHASLMAVLEVRIVTWFTVYFTIQGRSRQDGQHVTQQLSYKFGCKAPKMSHACKELISSAYPVAVPGFEPRTSDMRGERVTTTPPTHVSLRSSVNTFACSDVKIQMRPTCVGGVLGATRVQCFPLVWTHRSNYAGTGGRPFKREWCEYEQNTYDWEVLTGGSIDLVLLPVIISTVCQQSLLYLTHEQPVKCSSTHRYTPFPLKVRVHATDVPFTSVELASAADLAGTFPGVSCHFRSWAPFTLFNPRPSSTADGAAADGGCKVESVLTRGDFVFNPWTEVKRILIAREQFGIFLDHGLHWRSEVANLSASATPNRTRKTAPSSANDGVERPMHGSINAAAGSGSTVRWKSPMPNQTSLPISYVTDWPTPTHTNHRLSKSLRRLSSATQAANSHSYATKQPVPQSKLHVP
ncbi:hypothetical protein CLF_108689 [Clonorchis sinensis]|uniref:Uncharacterized protein n=1 Tax=Clonorchis sinensis TaxID=79923 RepID=G7YIF1_CLOSI|nr:hypothetical protein CLF_108689 [Clonorchis sinensis]